jgi:hypothetical protein
MPKLLLLAHGGGIMGRINLQDAGDSTELERFRGHEIDDVDRRDGFGTLGFATCGVRCLGRSRSDVSNNDGYEAS